MTLLSIPSFWQAEFDEHRCVLAETEIQLEVPFVEMLEVATVAVKSGNKILFAGNGGSAADAQHWATELTVRYKKDRPAIAAIALTTDTSALTAIGNDFGFDYLFSRQVEALGKSGDVLIAISTSGNSRNIINAIEVAKEHGMKVIGLTGKSGGKMSEMCDVLINVPSGTTARIQEMHEIIGHMLCGGLEQNLGLVDEDTRKIA